MREWLRSTIAESRVPEKLSQFLEHPATYFLLITPKYPSVDSAFFVVPLITNINDQHFYKFGYLDLLCHFSGCHFSTDSRYTINHVIPIGLITWQRSTEDD